MPLTPEKFTRSGGTAPNNAASADVLADVNRSPSALTLSLLLASCSAPESEPQEALPEVLSTVLPEAWEAPSDDGPVLIGTVRGPDGTPLEGVEVTGHGGYATRFRLQSTSTDSEGRFRFAPIQGSPLGTPFDNPPELMVGVSVGSVRNANPPEFLPWRDLRIPNRPGIVERADFTYDESTIPPEHRDH